LFFLAHQLDVHKLILIRFPYRDEVLWPRRAVVSAPSPFKTKPLLNPMQIYSLMRDDPLLVSRELSLLFLVHLDVHRLHSSLPLQRMERELMASIPDDFKSHLEVPSQEDIPELEIRHLNNDTSNYGDDNDEVGGGTGGGRLGRLSPKRLRFWQRNKQAATLEAETVDTLQLMAQSLKQEASIVGNPMPIMVLEGVEEEKSLGRRVLSKVLMPKSLLSFATREMG